MSKLDHLIELNLELSRLSQLIRWRQRFPEKSLSEVPFQELWGEDKPHLSSKIRPKTTYRKLICRMAYPQEERTLLLLPLVSAWYPSFFAKHFLREQVSYLPRSLSVEELDPLCGLTFQEHSRSLYPSLNTFIYLLAGQDLLSRAQLLLHIYRREYWLFKKNIILWEKAGQEEFLSSPLRMQATCLSALLANNSPRLQPVS